MKTCTQFLFLLLLIVCAGYLPHLHAQSEATARALGNGKFTLDGVTPDGTATFDLILPALEAKEGFEVKIPYYKRLFIHGDGSFRMDTLSAPDSKVVQQYGPSSDGLGQYYARAYANGVYSDEEDEPPKLQAPPVFPPPGATPQAPTQVVEPGRYLKITRNVEVLPGDPFVNIISVRNLDVEVPLQGKLFFFYNGVIRELPILQQASVGLEGLNFAASTPFSQFNIDNILSYRPRVSSGLNNFYAGVPDFGRVITIDIDNLAPGDEIHFFVEMTGDEAMQTQFDSKAKAQMDFLAVLATTDGQETYTFPKAIDTEKETALQQQGITARLLALDTIDADSAYTFDPGQNSGESVIDQGIRLNFLANRIIDAYTSTATLVSVHDPNFLLLESCACPEKQDRYQILTTIQCQNEGQTATADVYIDMKLPPGLSAENIVRTPISYHPPQMDPSKIRFELLAPDSIRWFFEDLALEGTPIYGVGDPRTYAQIQFHVYSDLPPADLPETEACIRFGYNGNILDPVCTEAVKVDLLGKADVATKALSCTVGSCISDPNNNDSGWPWWAWLLIALLVLIIIIWLARRS